MRDVIPWGRSRPPQRNDERSPDETSPFLTLHREMNRPFEDAFRGFGLGDMTRTGGSGFGWPQVEVTDFNKEIRVTADFPGQDDKDVEIRIEW